MDDIYRLRVFSHISKTLNFSETARQLHIAQPAVSRHIKRLEDDLGVSLFLRHEKKVRLTNSGKALLQQILPIITEFDRVIVGYNSEKNESQNVLNIGSIPEAGQNFLLEKLMHFQTLFPDIALNIEYGQSSDMLDKVSDGSVDFALVSRMGKTQALAHKMIFHDKPVLVGAKNFDISSSSLLKILLVKYRMNDYYTEAFIEKNIAKSIQNRLKVIGWVNSHESMLQWIKEKSAVCVVPKSSFENSRFRSTLTILREAKSYQKFYLVYLKNADIEFHKRQFLDEIN